MRLEFSGYCVVSPTTWQFCVANPPPGRPAGRTRYGLRGVKYTFVTAIEACIDVAQHICSAAGWGPPADNGDAMRLLGSHDVLTPDMADALRKAVGFRNVLVHEYVQVSDDIVTARLGDLEGFVEQVAAFITKAAEPH